MQRTKRIWLGENSSAIPNRSGQTPASVPPNGAFHIKRCSHVRRESGRSDHVPPRVVPLIPYLAAADPEFLLCPARANSPRETETDSASIRSLLQDTMGNISSRCGNNNGRTTRRRRRRALRASLAASAQRDVSLLAVRQVV